MIFTHRGIPEVVGIGLMMSLDNVYELRLVHGHAQF